MALNLFKRVDSVKGLIAVESISLIYNALTTIMVLILFPRMGSISHKLALQKAADEYDKYKEVDVYKRQTLSFSYLMRETIVRYTEVGRESQFHR